MSFVLGKDAVVLRKGWKSPEESSESGVRLHRSVSLLLSSQVEYDCVCLFGRSLTASDNIGAKSDRKRVGRGNASGHGTTAGRGKHGQNARSGPIS